MQIFNCQMKKKSSFILHAYKRNGKSKKNLKIVPNVRWLVGILSVIVINERTPALLIIYYLNAIHVGRLTTLQIIAFYAKNITANQQKPNTSTDKGAEYELHFLFQCACCIYIYIYIDPSCSMSILFRLDSKGFFSRNVHALCYSLICFSSILLCFYFIA